MIQMFFLIAFCMRSRLLYTKLAKIKVKTSYSLKKRVDNFEKIHQKIHESRLILTIIAKKRLNL